MQRRTYSVTSTNVMGCSTPLQYLTFFFSPECIISSTYNTIGSSIRLWPRIILKQKKKLTFRQRLVFSMQSLYDEKLHHQSESVRLRKPMKMNLLPHDELLIARLNTRLNPTTRRSKQNSSILYTHSIVQMKHTFWIYTCTRRWS